MAKYGLGCQAQAFPEHSGKGEVFHTFHSILPLQRAVEHLPNLQMALHALRHERMSRQSTSAQILYSWKHKQNMHEIQNGVEQRKASVKVGGVPQCSREVEHCGTLGTPAPFQNNVEQHEMGVP